MQRRSAHRGAYLITSAAAQNAFFWDLSGPLWVKLQPDAYAESG